MIKIFCNMIMVYVSHPSSNCQISPRGVFFGGACACVLHTPGATPNTDRLAVGVVCCFYPGSMFEYRCIYIELSDMVNLLISARSRTFLYFLVSIVDV